MVEQKLCSFCGESIEPGTGRLFVRKDGVTYSFCSNKCFKNMMVLKRAPRDTRWTAQYRRDKEIRLAAEAHIDRGETKKTVKVRKVVKPGKVADKKKAVKKETSVEEPGQPSQEPRPARKDEGDAS